LLYPGVCKGVDADFGIACLLAYGVDARFYGGSGGEHVINYHDVLSVPHFGMLKSEKSLFVFLSIGV
jgi:hypothetical protein